MSCWKSFGRTRSCNLKSSSIKSPTSGAHFAIQPKSRHLSKHSPGADTGLWLPRVKRNRSRRRPTGLPATRFVGRQRELASLRQSFRRALEGERQLIFITGEPGIGKTALVEEFVREGSAAEPSLRIARGHTVEVTSGAEAFYPVLDAVGQLCRGPDGTALVKLLAQH